MLGSLQDKKGERKTQKRKTKEKEGGKNQARVLPRMWVKKTNKKTQNARGLTHELPGGMNKGEKEAAQRPRTLKKKAAKLGEKVTLISIRTRGWGAKIADGFSGNYYLQRDEERVTN